MTDEPEAQQPDHQPFPEPYPEDTGFSPLDSDNRKEWRNAKAKWEAIHGQPE